jgi:hypothetical protein
MNCSRSSALRCSSAPVLDQFDALGRVEMRRDQLGKKLEHADDLGGPKLARLRIDRTKSSEE